MSKFRLNDLFQHVWEPLEPNFYGIPSGQIGAYYNASYWESHGEAEVVRIYPHPRDDSHIVLDEWLAIRPAEFVDSDPVWSSSRTTLGEIIHALTQGSGRPRGAVKLIFPVEDVQRIRDARIKLVRKIQ